MKKKGKYSRTFFVVVPLALTALLMLGAPGIAGTEKASDTGKNDSAFQKQAQGKEMSSDTQQTAGNKLNNDSRARAQLDSGNNQNLRNFRPLVDRDVISSRGDDIGEIENVVVNEDGSQIKAVLSVGGFLGMGDKNVLVGLDELSFDPKSDFVTFNGTEKDLEARAEYEAPDQRVGYARRPYAPYPYYDRSYGRGYYGARDRDYGEYDQYPHNYQGGRYRGGDKWGYGDSDRFGWNDRDRYNRDFQRFPSGEDRYSSRGYYEGRQDSRYPYRDDSFSQGRFRDESRYGGASGQSGYQQPNQYPSSDDRYGASFYNQQQEGYYYPARDEGRMRGQFNTRHPQRYPSKDDYYDRQSRQGSDQNRDYGQGYRQ